MKSKMIGIFVCTLLIAGGTAVLADWVPDDGHKMHYPQLPNEIGWDVNATVPIILADDWQCSETGWVKDIHFWGSWLDGYEGIVDSFVLSIHDNIPGPPYSMPGPTLWEWTTSDFDVIAFTNGPEGWYDPSTGDFFFENHLEYYQYNVFLPEAVWFWQEAGTIYWLNICAFVHDPGVTQWGWKSSLDHWEDDACWAFWGELFWIDIWEPPDFTVSLDLAFVITGGRDSLDFGDAPDPTYPTLLASDGARHIIVPGIFLGASIDAELNGQPTADALGDDNDGNDDEDGVVFTSLVVQGNMVNVKVTASVGGLLDAWVDFNADGDWADAGENIFASTALVAGVNYLTFTVPTGAQVGTTYSRFRFNTAGAALSYTGQADDGEVEDYRVFILSPIENSKMHWPQLPDLDNTGMDVDMYTVPLADDWMCSETGLVTDIHFWGSFADDILPIDGVGALTFQLTIHADIPSPPHSMPGEELWSRVFVPGEYVVYQVADNGPEDWYDPVTGLWSNDNHLQAYLYEFYITEDPFMQEEGTIYWLEIKDIPPPDDYTFGWKTTEIDLHWNDDATWLSDPPSWWSPMTYPMGHEYAGTTLDLAFVITGEPYQELDFGDAPDPTYPTLLASDGARHIIVPGVFLGATIDPEANGQPTADALGDDNDGNDDEDGVVFTSLVVQGNLVNVKVTASVGGFLDGWIDFNADGDWADAGENIFASTALAAGVNYLTFTVPAGAQVGTTYSRFRFNTAGGLGYTGQAFDGEVEDYRVFILRPIENSKMHWPQLPDLDNTGMDVDMFHGPLADDWMCSETGLVTDIHFWGSFADDILPLDGVGALTFQLTIYDDIPGPPHSMPGNPLWSQVFIPGQYDVSQVADNNPEDWYDPWTQLWINDNHLQAYLYEFYITDEPFMQEAGTVYWLEVKDIPPPEDYVFGWKTTEIALHWNDDAVYWLPGWTPMMYPPGHEYELTTLDLAFVITGEPYQELDFGDAPDPTYPTLLASDGARHIIVPGVFLGATIDPEANGQSTADALGDDNDGNDDEDGVVFTSLAVLGNVVNVKVTASVGGFLDGWIDFNGDGDWADPGENIFNSTVLPAGVNVLSFTVPVGAQVGTTYSRFRFSTAGGLNYTGQAHDGEVEDYRVFILRPIENGKWEQPPDLDNTGMDVSMYWAPLADDWMCTESGAVTDIHFWGSFEDDILPAGGVDSLTFELTIYADIPGPPHSMPGGILWNWIFSPGQYDVYQVADNNPEDWYDPATALWLNDDHLQAYLYEFYITQEPFMQEEGTIYWIGIKDIPPPYDYTFGWKTTPISHHWNDDATWLSDPPSYWSPLTYPMGHEYAGTTLDLAFVITGGAVQRTFIRGDANQDTTLSMSDAIRILRWLYIPGEPDLSCYDAADVNDDGDITMGDAIYLLKWLYVPGEPIPPPPCCAYPDSCGPDPTLDTLDCLDHPCQHLKVIPTSLEETEERLLRMQSSEVKER